MLGSSSRQHESSEHHQVHVGRGWQFGLGRQRARRAAEERSAAIGGPYDRFVA
jgi:hypothetical protein